VIKKDGSRFVVCSEDGKPMGTYDTMEEAEKRLAQIEMHKAMSEHGEKKKMRGKGR
jgi:hypothetical protein